MKDTNAPTNAVVGLTSAQILAESPRRTGLFIRNLSNHTIAIAFGNDAVIGSGINLLKDESFSMGAYDFSTAAVNAIADFAGCNISIQEFVLE